MLIFDNNFNINYIKIRLKMSFRIRFDELSKSLKEKIRKDLIIYPKVDKFNNDRDSIEFFIMDECDIFLPYYYSHKLLGIAPNQDKIHKDICVEFTGKLRENQKNVVNEIIDHINDHGCSIIGLYPGFGKTILGAFLSTMFKYKTVVLVHREFLLNQWMETFLKVTDTKRVCICSKKIKDFDEYDIIICMARRTKLIPEKIREEIGFLIIDEAHTFCTKKHFPAIFDFEPKIVVAETATLERDDELHCMIEFVCGNVGVYREFDLSFRVHRVNTMIRGDIERTVRGINYQKLESSIYNNDERINIVLDIVKKNIMEKILIITKQKNHAEMINKLLNENGIENDLFYGSKKTYKDGKVLIGTISKIGTGFDQESLCAGFDGIRFNVLILTCSIKMYSLLFQVTGRVFRCERPVIYHLVDTNGIHLGHWNKCRKWYISKGGIISNSF